MYIYIYTHKYIHIYMCACLYVYIYVYVYIYIRTCKYVFTYTYIYISIFTRINIDTCMYILMYIYVYIHTYIYMYISGNSFREIAGLFRMAPRGHVQTLTPRTWERRRASCRCVRRGKCRSLKMRVLETERTSSPNVNITAYIQPRGASRSNDTFQRLCGTLWS